MSVFEKPPRHRSYLLTFWQERSHDASVPVVWRFSLKDSRTGQRCGFSRADYATFHRDRTLSLRLISIMGVSRGLPGVRLTVSHRHLKRDEHCERPIT